MSPENNEPGAPHTVLFASVRMRLTHAPFAPFRIVTTSGQSYDVPTVDHASVTPFSRMIHVAGDDGGIAEIHALHIAAIEPLRKRRRTA